MFALATLDLPELTSNIFSTLYIMVLSLRRGQLSGITQWHLFRTPTVLLRSVITCSHFLIMYHGCTTLINSSEI
jgi:hypothetical protein